MAMCPSVCLSVRPSHAIIASKRLNGSSLLLAWRLPSTYPMLKDIHVSSKIRILPSGTLSQTQDLEILQLHVDRQCVVNLHEPSV